MYTPCAVEVVLTQAAASGDHGMIKPEGRAAVPVHTAFISIITVEQKVSPQKADEQDFTKIILRMEMTHKYVISSGLGLFLN